jgi:hypothetical protein
MCVICVLVSVLVLSLVGAAAAAKEKQAECGPEDDLRIRRVLV